jgi:hypothetical protein
MAVLFVLAFLSGSIWLLSSDTQNVGISPVSATEGVTAEDKARDLPSQTSATKNVPEQEPVLLLKDVGEPQYEHLGLIEADFARIKAQGFTAIEGTFDICANHRDVSFFMDSAHKHGLQVILNAGAGEAEWGYPCDGGFVLGQKPRWEREKVQEWVRTWKDHPALLAWDTSNEDGGTMPFGTGGVNPQPNWEKTYALSVDQLKQAYTDVKIADPDHPIMIRMNGWYFYDNEDDFFRPGNAFVKGVADIVMVNAYANVEEYFPDFVGTVMTRARQSISLIDPNVAFLPSLGVWEEPPIWYTPSVEELENDFNQAILTDRLYGISYFKYGAYKGDDWYLPDSERGDTAIWNAIRDLNTEL